MLRSLFLWLSEQGRIFNFVKSNGMARRIASRFVAGETIDSAIGVTRLLNEKGIAASLDLLGESVSSQEEAQAARDEVVQTLDEVARTGADANVSVKLTQLGLDIDYDLCLENMRVILSRAKERNIFVRMDMENSAHTERTLRIFKDLHPDFGNLTGVVIQSYLRRSAEDIEDLISMGARVRLCKGAYAEPEAVAYQDRREIDSSFDALMVRLLDEGSYPGIATHDEQRIERTLAHVQMKQIPYERFEFQMLYGVRRDLYHSLRGRGFNVRVYIPFGSNWYPYLMRRLAERPGNLAFMTASIVKETFSRS
ncbi:MAG: proline dehydrogenase family protein [Gemmatimonadota bacterium]|nr:MAG: proline dehydrogenase family protein [Gemmatimonadota bacterium]